jgi:hypothetical protein
MLRSTSLQILNFKILYILGYRKMTYPNFCFDFFRNFVVFKILKNELHEAREPYVHPHIFYHYMNFIVNVDSSYNVSTINVHISIWISGHAHFRLVHVFAIVGITKKAISYE